MRSKCFRYGRDAYRADLDYIEGKIESLDSEQSSQSTNNADGEVPSDPSTEEDTGNVNSPSDPSTEESTENMNLPPTTTDTPDTNTPLADMDPPTLSAALENQITRIESQTLNAADLAQAVQTLRNGLPLLAASDPGLMEDALANVAGSWIGNYHRPEIEGPLSPIVQHYFSPGQYVEIVSTKLSEQDGEVVDKAIGDIRAHLGNIRVQGELDGAARMIAQGIQQRMYDVDRQLELMTMLDPHIVNLSQAASADVMNMLERTARTTRVDLAEYRLWDQFDHMFPENSE